MARGAEVLRLRIMGKPQPQGSLTAFVLWKSKRDPDTDEPTQDRWKWVPLRRDDGSIAVNVTSDNDELKAWRAHVADRAKAALGIVGAGNIGDPEHGFEVEMTSYLKRPANQWGAAGNLKDWAPARPLVKPDVDKLLRAALDALTGVVWKDDSQVVRAATEKVFAIPLEDTDAIRAELVVWHCAEQAATDLPEDQRRRWVPPAAGPPGQEALLLP